MNTENYFYVDLGVIDCETFSQVYPGVNHAFMSDDSGLQWQPSRDGSVKEMLNVKTVIRNPYRRCVGGYGRNINIFFLLAEAMWIASGRKDVGFLTIFNKQMAKYSDNGTVFHAPYGYRVRHWGKASESPYAEGAESARGYDQLADAVRLLGENHNTRQVVISIWNPSFDLGFVTKDIPCNDILMFKIRDEKLITTIGNRSNDLHLGLPTNVFQFSFLTEIMSLILGIELGTQTHNSQSLHVYDWNKTAISMEEKYNACKSNVNLYDIARERRIDFQFTTDLPVNRLKEVDIVLDAIINNLQRLANGEREDDNEIKLVHETSAYLYAVYSLLALYIAYRRFFDQGEHTAEVLDDQRRKSIAAVTAIEGIYFREVGDTAGDNWDIAALAHNFFAARLSHPDESDLPFGEL